MNRPDPSRHFQPDRKRTPSSIVVAIAALVLVGLGACSNGTATAQNHACATQATGTLPWGYYPGYGCGPVPRAQTVFP